MEPALKPEELRAIFSHNLRLLRKEKKITQQQLADLVGIKQPSIAALEAGNASPSLETIARIAEVFKIAPDVLLREGVFEPA